MARSRGPQCCCGGAGAVHTQSAYILVDPSEIVAIVPSRVPCWDYYSGDGDVPIGFANGALWPLGDGFGNATVIGFDRTRNWAVWCQDDADGRRIGYSDIGSCDNGVSPVGVILDGATLSTIESTINSATPWAVAWGGVYNSTEDRLYAWNGSFADPKVWSVKYDGTDLQDEGTGGSDGGSPGITVIEGAITTAADTEYVAATFKGSRITINNEAPSPRVDGDEFYLAFKFAEEDEELSYYTAELIGYDVRLQELVAYWLLADSESIGKYWILASYHSQPPLAGNILDDPHATVFMAWAHGYGFPGGSGFTGGGGEGIENGSPALWCVPIPGKRPNPLKFISYVLQTELPENDRVDCSGFDDCSSFPDLFASISPTTPVLGVAPGFVDRDFVDVSDATHTGHWTGSNLNREYTLAPIDPSDISAQVCYEGAFAYLGKLFRQVLGTEDDYGDPGIPLRHDEYADPDYRQEWYVFGIIMEASCIDTISDLGARGSVIRMWLQVQVFQGDVATFEAAPFFKVCLVPVYDDVTYHQSNAYGPIHECGYGWAAVNFPWRNNFGSPDPADTDSSIHMVKVGNILPAP